MQSFYVALKRDGAPIPAHDVQRFQDTVRRAVVFADHLSHFETRAIRADVHAIMVGNEPASPVAWEDEQTLVGASGAVTEIEAVKRLRPSRTLATDLSTSPGRFCALVADKRSGAVAVADTPARIDSLFTASNDQYVFYGTQASVVGMLCHGELRYSVVSMASFLSTSAYFDDRTAFEGVTLVPAMTTAVSERPGVLETDTTPLWELKHGEATPEQFAECTEAFLAALRPLAGAGRLEVSLSGGRDSRLMLAGALHASSDVVASTRENDTNESDVYAARVAAAVAGIEHVIITPPERANPAVEMTPERLLARTLQNVRVTDGMLSMQYPVSRPLRHVPTLQLNGVGGEVLRAGYAEHVAPRNREALTGQIRALAARNLNLLSDQARDQLQAHVEGWVEEASAHMTPLEALDCFYLQYRCGRWVAASTSGRSTPLPLLDSRFLHHLFGLPANLKRNDGVYREALVRLSPALLDVPVAFKPWRFLAPEERQRAKEVFPRAYIAQFRAANGAPRPRIDPSIAKFTVDYTLERLELLRDAVDLDAARAALQECDVFDQNFLMFLRAAHSAVVMLTEPWQVAS